MKLLLLLICLEYLLFCSADDILPDSGNVCALRPTDCHILCPYGYLKDNSKQCQCTCAIDPCQTTICNPSESCIAIGIKARCIPKFGSNREECPRLTGGICALRCEKDSDCTGRLICCGNGCGRECVAPISGSFPIRSESQPIQPISASLPGSFERLLNVVTNIASNTLNSTPLPPTIRNIANIFAPSSQPIRPQVIQATKVGQCPSPSSLNNSDCLSQKSCKNDMECNSVEKCCPNSCGATCMEPLKATGCIHMVIAISKLPERRLPNEYVPFCERNGRFSAIQCDLTSCWCVDVHYGTEIIGTRVSKNQRRTEMCTEKKLCSQKCHNHCTHGHVLDPFGCPLQSCKCLDICQNVDCRNIWESCQLVEPDCANPPCLPVPRCLLNPCRYGHPTKLVNGLTALCSADKDCMHSNCFKIGYNGLGFCCPGPETSIKDGRCPSQSALGSKCSSSKESSCYSDNDCADESKCCFNGCVLSCTEPEALSFKRISSTNNVSQKVHHYQPGDVEKYNKGHLSSLVADCADVINTNGSCSTECNSDSQCHGMKRCCRQGCSTMCMYPVRSTPCFHRALTAELYSLRNAMKCDRAGNFEQYQCDDEGCFCVDIVTGEHLPGTLAMGRKPNCEVRNPCEPLVCKSACPYGFEKGANFCPTCKCKNPCEDVKCPQGSVCVLSTVQCYQSGNCPFQPRCVINFCPTGTAHVSAIGNIESCTTDQECPQDTHWCHNFGISSGGICCPIPKRSINAGICPVVPISLDAKLCQVSCKVDDDCLAHQKCCFDGCGTMCKDISTPLIEISKEHFEKAGVCISEQRVLCNRLEKHTCEYDSDCAGVAKCCDDGCVKSCAYPLQTSKCLVRKTNLQKMGQMDLIKCRPDGSFEQIQCDVEFCWCVDEEGNYVDDTRTAEDITPNCPEPCPVPNCGVAHCEYGREKDSKGCQTCECVDPCKGVDCPDDSICIPTSVPCITKPCPTIPRCVINPCPNSEVVRNETTFRTKKCKSSNDCYDRSMTTHCSMLTQDDGFCCTGEAQVTNHGNCPKISDLTAARVDNCIQECKKDADCGSSKCCWNGCGLSCVTVAGQNSNILPQHHTAADEHFGECLIVAPIGAFCLQRPTIADCKTDSECPSLYKCCSDGCVNRCTHPINAPLCVQQRLAALSIMQNDESSESSEKVQEFVPECDANGNFDEIQSHFGLMWCVNEQGLEIPGTKSTNVPDCQKPRVCSLIECDKKCAHGFKTDNNGCPVCDCASPCAFVQCPAGNVCRLVPVSCSDSNNCLPVAKCIPNMCATGEPLALDADYLLAVCSINSTPCPAGYYCKSSGFTDISICCPAPEPPQQSLKCPQIPTMLASVDGSSCVVGCRHHTDCKQSSCCFNGCGTSCQFETRRVPIKPVMIKKPTKKPILSSLKVEKTASRITNVVSNVVETVPIPKFTKLGTCPNMLINPGCTEQCKVDEDCHGFFKCCRASCGSLCSAPRISTACIHRLIAFESKPTKGIISVLSPPIQCSNDGLFRKVQCDSSSNQCWCVDVSTGIEETGTRTFSFGAQPLDCSAPKLCTVRCNLMNCAYGIRLDSKGCPMNGACECKNICESFQCPQSMECALRRVECTTHPCPDVPICIDVICPVPQRDVYQNVIICENDGGCGKNSRCVLSQGSQFGLCCLQKVTQSSVLNLMAPVIVATTEMSIAEVREMPTIVQAVPETPTIVKSVSVPVLEKQDVLVETNCTTIRSALQTLINFGAILETPVPLCSKSGNFETTQCDGKRCWCVDQISGEEVHGTRKKLTRNACKSQSICLSKCSQSMCPYGLVLDSAGCPRSECICKSACEHVECPNGQVCILRKSNCGDRWCLPIPTCEKSPCNSGLRPLVETRTRQQYSCSQNAICPAGYYCTAFDNYMYGVCCPGNDTIKSIGDDKAVGVSCPHGDPFSSLSDGTPLSCTVLTNGCPSTHYCSTIAGQTSGFCCVSKRHVCNLQRDPGPCRAKVARFFYSSITHSCDAFNYGGCSGNLNNFATREDCDNFCAGIGLDFSDDHDSAHLPVESYQIAFDLTGMRIDQSRTLDAERQLINVLVEKFNIPRDSIEDVIIRDDNHVKFTIRDVEARKFAREVSEQASNGQLTVKLAGNTLKAEPHTLVAHHVSSEQARKQTAKVVFLALLLVAVIFFIIVISVFLLSCFCYYRNQKPKSRSTTPANTATPTHLQRVFSRDDISICSDFNRPPMLGKRAASSDSRPKTRQRAQSWMSID